MTASSEKRRSWVGTTTRRTHPVAREQRLVCGDRSTRSAATIIFASRAAFVLKTPNTPLILQILTPISNKTALRPSGYLNKTCGLHIVPCAVAFMDSNWRSPRRATTTPHRVRNVAVSRPGRGPNRNRAGSPLGRSRGRRGVGRTRDGRRPSSVLAPGLCPSALPVRQCRVLEPPRGREGEREERGVRPTATSGLLLLMRSISSRRWSGAPTRRRPPGTPRKSQRAKFRGRSRP